MDKRSSTGVQRNAPSGERTTITHPAPSTRWRHWQRTPSR
ncbi:hypothetical protein XHC_3588 [Xanthomonas hortorum pv. carotae str. M081]|nr:hypothetical protein XHC_3588 [Xanthomonas hortorum pv. carotae str. M081]